MSLVVSLMPVSRSPPTAQMCHWHACLLITSREFSTVLSCKGGGGVRERDVLGITRCVWVSIRNKPRLDDTDFPRSVIRKCKLDQGPRIHLYELCPFRARSFNALPPPPNRSPPRSPGPSKISAREMEGERKKGKVIRYAVVYQPEARRPVGKLERQETFTFLLLREELLGLREGYLCMSSHCV